MPIRAAVMTAPREPIRVQALPDPPIAPGGILLDTIASEVCGTDVHLHHGRLAGVPYPIVPGHVSVGRVAEARGVDRDALGEPLAPGDVVTFYDVHETCGACFHCAVAGQPNRCPSRRVYGITYSAAEGPLGGWAERIYLKPGVRVLKLPDGLSSDDVIGGGCGLFTGFAAVERSALAMGDVVVVQGAGPVGLSAAAFAALRGAGAVVVIGAPHARLALAARLGADLTLSVSEDGAGARLDAVRARTGGRGADVVIEASGNPAAVPEGLELLRDGGTYVVAGHYTDAGAVSLNPHRHINRKHAEVRGQWGTDFRHVVRALRMLGKHRDRLPFRHVIGGRYGLEDAGRALADVEALRVTKAIIEPALSRFCLVGLAAVAGVVACGRGEPEAFRVSPQQFYASTHVVAMAPVKPPAELALAETGLARLDTLLDGRLRDGGFQVVPSAEYAQIWQVVLERVGGIYDPHTGVPDDARLAEARLQLADELELAFGADAILYPELWVEEVPFSDGSVQWHGVSEGVVRTAPAIVGAVLGTLAALGDGGDGTADGPSGMVRVLSLHVFIEDLAGVETYRRAGGVRVLEKMGWHATDWDPVDPEDVLNDDERNRRAVDVALEPLISR